MKYLLLIASSFFSLGTFSFFDTNLRCELMTYCNTYLTTRDRCTSKDLNKEFISTSFNKGWFSHKLIIKDKNFSEYASLSGNILKVSEEEFTNRGTDTNGWLTFDYELDTVALVFKSVEKYSAINNADRVLKEETHKIYECKEV